MAIGNRSFGWQSLVWIQFCWSLLVVPERISGLSSALPSSTRYSDSARNNDRFSVATEILHALRVSTTATSKAGTASEPPPLTTGESSSLLDLEIDFYDPSTGLHNEGVWHNCVIGLACLKLGSTNLASGSSLNQNQQQQQQQQQQRIQEAVKIATSLHRHAWDGTSFRRRAWSGQWDHSRLDEGHPNPPVQDHYYRESSEHRCVQHGIALLFWSRLVQCCTTTSVAAVATDASVSSDLCRLLRDQQQEIATSFFEQFWNSNHSQWTTVSQEQGGGTTLRPNASSNQPPKGGDSEEGKPYIRAVDQAVSILACLAHLDAMDTAATKPNSFSDTEMEREDVRQIIQRTCQELVTSFGFGSATEVKTYIGLDRNINFWHEGWVLLALLEAQKHNLLEGDPSLVEDVYHRLVQVYGDDDDGTVWHWPTSGRDVSQNVRYCGDNAMMDAIRQTMRVDEDSRGFGDFIDLLRSRDGSELASVADAYPQVRLHPNTELVYFFTWL